MPKNNQKDFSSRSPQLLFWGLLCLFLLLVALVWIIRSDRSRSAGVFVNEESQEILPTGFSLLTGRPLFNEQSTDRPIMVIFDNYVDARPIDGLNDASIFYELIAEGDITRILALYEKFDLPEAIGPIRSVRPYFLDIAAEWGSVVVHAGGSPEALSLIKRRNGQYYSLNEVSADGVYFWRNKDRLAPHNIYTSGAMITTAIQNKKIDNELSFVGWQFNQGLNEDLWTTSQEILLKFSKDTDYHVLYSYDPGSLLYHRSDFNNSDSINNSNKLKIKTLIVQWVNYVVIDSYGRLKVDLTAGGKALIFSNGLVQKASWEKRDHRTFFYDSDGKEIIFEPGKIWISILFNNKGGVSYSGCPDDLL